MGQVGMFWIPTFMDGNQIILRQDRLGRVQRTAEQRAAIVEEFHRSGLSLRRFAQLSGIGYNTLWMWLKQAGVKLRESPSTAPRLLRAVVALPVEAEPISAAAAPLAATTAAAAADVLCVALGNGVSIQVASAVQASLAALLIKALNASTPC
jgi:transposase-like protein